MASKFLSLILFKLDIFFMTNFPIFFTSNEMTSFQQIAKFVIKLIVANWKAVNRRYGKAQEKENFPRMLKFIVKGSCV